jgi:hypothetical protein
MKMFPKVITGVLGIAATLALSTATTQANLLFNPSFESASGFVANPITLAGVNGGWANNFGGYAPSQSSAYVENGTYSLLTQNNVGNNWNPVGTYQIVSGITVGQTYTLTAWAYTPSVTGNVAGAGPIDVQLQFLDSSLANLSTTETGWSALANGAWTQYTVSATAPAGAVYASPYLMFMEANQTVAESVYFDNAVLDVPEPGTLALLGLSLPLFLIRRRK